MKVMITKTVAIKLSGKDLADEFWELSCQEQADFFNKNGFVRDDFNHGFALLQIDRLTELLDENGKRFVSKLYESMKGWQDMRKCEDCVYYGELKTEQPCCGCVDFVNFERDHPTEKGGAE